MIYLQIAPSQVEIFKQRLQDDHWHVTNQDGGQGHFIGWSYLIQWQKDIEGKLAEVTLHFSENQGVQESHLELNPAAKVAVQTVLDQLSNG